MEAGTDSGDRCVLGETVDKEFSETVVVSTPMMSLSTGWRIQSLLKTDHSPDQNDHSPNDRSKGADSGRCQCSAFCLVVQVMIGPYKQAGFPCLIQVFFNDSWGLSRIGGFEAKDTDIPPGHYQGLLLSAQEQTQISIIKKTSAWLCTLVWGVGQARAWPIILAIKK